MKELSIEQRTNILINHRTCGDHCWHAREEICRCSCGGDNHGILLDPNNSIPTRTRRVEDTFFVLEAVVTGWENADNYVNEWYNQQGLRKPVSYSLKPTWGSKPLMGHSRPTKSQMEKWPEVTPFKDWQSKGRCYAEARDHEPFLIWKQQSPDIEGALQDRYQRLDGPLG